MNSERLWNANYWKVMVANFTMAFSGYLLTPLLPLYLSEQFGASKRHTTLKTSRKFAEYGRSRRKKNAETVY